MPRDSCIGLVWTVHKHEVRPGPKRTAAVKYVAHRSPPPYPPSAVSPLALFCTSGTASVSYSVLLEVTAPEAATYLLVAPESLRPDALSGGCGCDCLRAASTKAGFAPLPLFPDVNTGGDVPLLTSSPQFLFALVLLCSSSGAPVSARFDWSVHVTFSGTGSPEVGYDGAGLLPAFAVCVALAAALLLTLGCGHRWGSSAGWEGTHPLVKQAGLALGLWGLQVSLLLLHWVVYASNGVGFPAIDAMGRVAECGSRLVLTTLLLLLARGTGFLGEGSGSSRGRLLSFDDSDDVRAGGPARPPPRSPGEAGHGLCGACCSPGQRVVAVAQTCLTVAYIATAVWYVHVRDPGSTTYVYDSQPGLVTAGLYAALAAWLAWEALPRAAGLRSPALLKPQRALLWPILTRAHVLRLCLCALMRERRVPATASVKIP